MKEIAFTWHIPSFNDVLSSKVDVMQVNVESIFKARLDFTNIEDDQVNLYILPLLPVREFKLILNKWLDDPRRKPADPVASEIKLLTEATFHCVQPINWIHCHTMSVKNIKNELTTYFNSTYFNSITHEHSNGSRCNAITAVNAIIGIHFEIKYHYDATEKEVSKSSIVILNDYEQLFTSGKFYDAVIKTNEGKVFKVHKNILAARCEMLDAAFNHETIESETNLITTQFDNETIENLLLHLYCSKTPKIDMIAGKLLIAADYYHLDDLVYQCAKVLIKQLSVENAVSTLQLALTHSCAILEKGVLNFINDSNISDIVESEDWLQSDNVEVFKKMCGHFVLLFNKA